MYNFHDRLSTLEGVVLINRHKGNNTFFYLEQIKEGSINSFRETFDFFFRVDR